MKLVIDIPEDCYRYIKELQSLVMARGTCKTIQKDVIDAIKNGTPYEEQPIGEWILERIYYDNYHMIDNNIFYCSICGRRVTTTASKATVAVVYPFCHGCGTKMEEKSE